MLSRLYYSLRISLHKSRGLLRHLQAMRGWWILGPVRPYAVRFYQRFKENRPLEVNTLTIFPDLNVKHVVDALNEQGYASGMVVPSEYVNEILEYCQNTKLLKYWNPHNECEAIDRLAHNFKIVDIARQYLGAEPILWLTQLRWSFGNPVEQSWVVPSRYPEPVQYDGDAFHYDTLDFKSLTIFIYLTEVGFDSGPHVVIGRTHKKKTFSEIRHVILDDATARHRFEDQIKVILGRPGTMLFEETSSYHKAAKCKTSRLMLSIDYVLQRSPPPVRPRLAPV